MRGKSWAIEQERQLRELVKEGASIAQISQAMGKTRVAVRSKIYHLGLSVVDATAAPQHVAASIASVASIASTPQTQPIAEEKPIDFTLPKDTIINHPPLPGPSSAPNPKDTDTFTSQLKRDGPLPSIEEKLRVLDAALVALEKPGLSTAEISRLNKIIQGVKVYQELFASFVDYKALETELEELRKQLASEKNQQ